MIANSSRTTAYTLGLLGTLPFIAGATAAWLMESYHRVYSTDILIVYAALILTFIGAIHWGMTLQKQQAEQGDVKWLIWSNLPCLIAWPLVFAPQGLALLGVVAALILCLLIDYLAWRKQRFPGWMLRLRIVLTVIVVVSLLVAWLAHVLRPEGFFHPAIYYAV